MIEFLHSRQRPKNAISILESSSLWFRRGTARFIARTRKSSRRFLKLGPEILQTCFSDHHATSHQEDFSFFLLPFYRCATESKFHRKKRDPRTTVESSEEKNKNKTSFKVAQ